MSVEIRVRYDALVAAIEEALAAEGIPEHVRRVEAELMAEADLMGVASHGVRMLPLIVTAIRDGRANPDPQLRLVRDYEAVCVLDGDRGLGRFVSVRGMEQAVARARRFGVGICVANRVSHWGRAHAYAYLPRAGDDRHLHHQCRSQHDRVGIAAACRGQQSPGHRCAAGRGQ